MNQEIAALFATHHLRATSSRLAILRIFQDASAPLAPAEITKKHPSIDKVSIYRTIDTFKKIGLLTSVAHGWKQRYELAAPFRPHHHHLLCDMCGAIEEIQSEKLEQLIHLIADEYSFNVQSHIFEVNGICRICQTRV
jgi:Fe2+ or Zn2+ uptake regulation protein